MCRKKENFFEIFMYSKKGLEKRVFKEILIQFCRIFEYVMWKMFYILNFVQQKKVLIKIVGEFIIGN